MAQKQHRVTALIRRYVVALEARGIPVERVILFGSHATGRAQPWSDIDIAVISPKFDTMSLLERYEQLGLANCDLQAPLEVVGFSPIQVANCEPESFLAEILTTGREVPLRMAKTVAKHFGNADARQQPMKQLVIEYPEGLPGLLKLSEGEFAAEIRFLAAAKLYEMGRLSSGKAAEMAGIGRVEFLHKLRTYGFHAINLDDEQIEAELKAAAELPQ
jgi:predicted nucleotidyltransferase/predicted HTH domain antitoxin